MNDQIQRRQFLRTVAGCAACLGIPGTFGCLYGEQAPVLLSPGCRRSKVRVARLYLGIPGALWPTPNLDLTREIADYAAKFEAQKKELADVEFVVDRLISTVEEAQAIREELGTVDGVLAIHLSMGVTPILNEVLAANRPTVLFAAPYSGHEWTGFGWLMDQPAGALLDCMLTSDPAQLVAAIRPLRAIHHLRETVILNVIGREMNAEFLQAVQDKFGTQVKAIDQPRMLEVYESVSDADAEAETERWIRSATAVVEPPRDEVFRSCKLALAFERLLDMEEATMMTVDCYGSMYRQLPAFPCIGFTRLNDRGFGGICESDLRSAMTFLIMQGLSGRPGFISDPTMDTASDSIILAHCLGTTRMDGPDGPAAPYKLRTIMERQEGAVPQVKMRVGEKVTQAIMMGTTHLQYFTGRIIDAPESDRGCRTKITVQVDGDAARLWRNWSGGLHRVTCYGDITPDLRRFCRFKALGLVQEA